ncbi:MAG: GNAT family N-acetyltransferase [Bacteroidota bacterium]
MDSVIRVAKPGDVDRIIPLWNEFLESQSDKVPFLRTDKDAEITASSSISRRIGDPDYQFFLAEEENELAGFLSCQIVEPTHLIQETGGYITETIVKDTYQRKGIGTQLFQTAANWMYEKGASFIQLRMAVNNLAVHTFCQKEGFEPIFYQMVYKRRPKK